MLKTTNTATNEAIRTLDAAEIDGVAGAGFRALDEFCGTMVPGWRGPIPGPNPFRVLLPVLGGKVGF